MASTCRGPSVQLKEHHARTYTNTYIGKPVCNYSSAAYEDTNKYYF